MTEPLSQTTPKQLLSPPQSPTYHSSAPCRANVRNDPLHSSLQNPRCTGWTISSQKTSHDGLPVLPSSIVPGLRPHASPRAHSDATRKDESQFTVFETHRILFLHHLSGLNLWSKARTGQLSATCMVIFENFILVSWSKPLQVASE